MTFHLQGKKHHRTLTGHAGDFLQLARCLREAAGTASKASRSDFDVPHLSVGGEWVDRASFRLTPDIAPIMTRHRRMMRLRPLWLAIFLLIAALGFRDWLLCL